MLGGLVQVVQRGEGADAEVAHQAEDLQLVADVEMVGGLVEQEQAALLGQGPGDENPLLLPAGQRGETAVGQMAAPTRSRAWAQMSSSSAVVRSKGGPLCGVRPRATISATVKASSAGVS